ncbi:hypothetical protein [Streptomyces sp. IBSBF 3010]|uniref:hypothetical protein n=1 Tax=Streptomyces sp. IBSBF 3010 TaxID=2903526 RepID=UPI002FDC48FB
MDAIEPLPDDHKRPVSFIITVAEFRELMRSAMYRADDLAATDGETADVLRSAAWKLGEAWKEGDAPETLHCVRCGRKYRHDERDQLVDAGEGKLKCDPKGPLWDACMRVYNAV